MIKRVLENKISKTQNDQLFDLGGQASMLIDTDVLVKLNFTLCGTNAMYMVVSYLHTRQYELPTVVKHIPFLVSFLRWHTEQGYATITHDSVTAYLTEMYATKTKGYATVIRSYLRSFCHYLQTQGIIEEIAFDYKPDKEKEEDPFKLHGVYNYYRYLGVSKTADLAEIKKAYHNKARSLHPDVNQDDPNATNRVMALNKVYDTLKNDQDRLAYDVTMGYVTYDDDYLDSLDLTWHEKEFYFIRI